MDGKKENIRKNNLKTLTANSKKNSSINEKQNESCFYHGGVANQQTRLLCKQI